MAGLLHSGINTLKNLDRDDIIIEKQWVNQHKTLKRVTLFYRMQQPCGSTKPNIKRFQDDKKNRAIKMGYF